jgi:hypothetical protein
VPLAVSAPPWARPYEPAAARADASIVLVTQSTAGFAMLVLQGALGPPITVPARSLVAVLAVLGLVGGMLLAYLGLLGAALAVPMWMHRCYRNLPALGSRGHFSPAWAAGCWFIPIANLVLPYVAVRDVWAASRPGERWNAALVAGWWIAWLAAWALMIAHGRLPWRGYVELMSAGLMAAAGALFICIVHLITRGQRRRAAALA